MGLDTLIFAAIAGFLVYRLRNVLGTRHGDERPRPNPFDKDKQAKPPAPGATAEVVTLPVAAAAAAMPAASLSMGNLIDADANKEGRIDAGLADIAAADAAFDPGYFMQGARYAFEMIVTAYARGDLATLKPLLSPKLYTDFESGIRAREALGHTSELTIHRIVAAKIIEAHLGGTMAYVTVDFDVEETTVTRDRDGQVVDGNPDRIFSVEDIWTFTRDTRAPDPNWILIETRAVEK